MSLYGVIGYHEGQLITQYMGVIGYHVTLSEGHTITPYKETLVPHLVATLIHLSQIYSYYIRGDRLPLKHSSYPKHLYNNCTTLDQRRRRWADVVLMLYKCFVITGWSIKQRLD